MSSRIKIACANLLSALSLVSCASLNPILAPRIAEPNTPAARNFTSFSSSLRCLDSQLAKTKRPRILISSTGIPDLTRKVSVGGDDMLVNAINQMNSKSRAYIFVDQPRERANGQNAYLTRDDEITQPRLYIRGSISQLDNNVVKDAGKFSLDLEDTPHPLKIIDGPLSTSETDLGRNLSVVSVDLHLVSWPSKTVIPGSSVANSMVVRGDTWGIGAEGLIKMTGFDFSLKMQRVESPGQAVRNLIELGVIELLGRHANVPFWECLQLRTTNEKATQSKEKSFVSASDTVKVTDAQSYLKRLGYFDASVTGIFDRETRRAVSRFQADEKLIATGNVDFDVLERLREKALGVPILATDTNRRDASQTREIPIFATRAHRSLARSTASLDFVPSRGPYKMGEVFSADLRANYDGYLACFQQTGLGPIVQILPVEPNTRMRVTAGTTLRVPHIDSRFDIRFETSEEEAILCLLDQTGSPVRISKASAQNPLDAIRAKSFAELIRAYRTRSENVTWKQVRARAAP